MSFYNLNPNNPGEQLARELEQFNGYRVLRRLPQPEEIWCRSMPVPDNIFKLAVVDVETTGLDPKRHRMIELAIGILSIDLDTGDVVDVELPQSWLEDPAEDLSLEIERLTHITSDMLIGKWFPDDEVCKVIGSVDGIVAHNARFDRGFLSRRFPAIADLPWLCSLSEIDWPEHGFSNGRSIISLLTQAGFFLPNAHRAGADVWATTCLLASNAQDGRALAAHLVEKARRNTYRLYAMRAPFECKDGLKAAGYRWSPERRSWWIEGDEERIDNEAIWLRDMSRAIVPTKECMSWMNRYE